MAEIQDLHLHDIGTSSDSKLRNSADGAASESAQSSERAKWIVLVAILAIGAALVGYVVWRPRTAPAPAAVASAPAPAAAATTRPSGPLVEADKIDLPPLPETDAIVRQLVVKLSSHPKVLAWLATDGLIQNFAVVTLNVSEGKTPVMHLRALAPQARFSALQTARGFVVDPRSYRRFDDFAAAVSGLDAAGTARLYLTLKPRITDAYRELGYPEGDFDRLLESALKPLVNTPVIDSNAVLRQKVLSYQFVDADIESLSPAQKQLLRMGPDNMRRVQDKLREIGRMLGLQL
jgi:DUF3014 family protein